MKNTCNVDTSRCWPDREHLSCVRTHQSSAAIGAHVENDTLAPVRTSDSTERFHHSTFDAPLEKFAEVCQVQRDAAFVDIPAANVKRACHIPHAATEIGSRARHIRSRPSMHKGPVHRCLWHGSRVGAKFTWQQALEPAGGGCSAGCSMLPRRRAGCA